MNVESDVTASGTVKSAADVDASVNASETLGLEEPRPDENLGKIDVNPTVDDTTVVQDSTKVDVDPIVDSVQKVVYETHAEQDVTASGQTSDKPDDVPNALASVMPENLGNVVPDTPEDIPATGNEKSPSKLTVDEENWSEDHTVVNSQRV
ncbi:hypothetical protein A2U01_0046977 [Trifolium medium]|uniref:Uncharacterized protein n=1 Tax=Trifolium medium TaxID=97028 RepID=A0A392QQH8_9FABA|nr:hypothetical protein [Trifolium medium]